jgi:hypothetical protein
MHLSKSVYPTFQQTRDPKQVVLVGEVAAFTFSYPNAPRTQSPRQPLFQYTTVGAYCRSKRYKMSFGGSRPFQTPTDAILKDERLLKAAFATSRRSRGASQVQWVKIGSLSPSVSQRAITCCYMILEMQLTDFTLINIILQSPNCRFSGTTIEIDFGRKGSKTRVSVHQKAAPQTDPTLVNSPI